MRANTQSHCRTRRSAFVEDTRGIAAIEFALIAGFLLVAMINAVDLATYMFQRMEVENAAQMAAQAAWQACDIDKLPATKNCPELSNAINAAIQSTSLGDAVKLHSTPDEGYFCLNDEGGLEHVSDVSSKPTDCAKTGRPDLEPGNYISVAVTFDYSPLFLDLSLAKLLPSPITQTAFLRLR